MARLVSMLQLWALCIAMVILPLWFLNGLLWPALSIVWLLILCVVVGTAILAALWFKVLGKEF